MICMEIPVSLMGAIAVMYFAGYTFNSMTLLALLLLIGVVVDDAIVVRESILRHMSGEVGTGLKDLDLNDRRAVDAYRKNHIGRYQRSGICCAGGLAIARLYFRSCDFHGRHHGYVL